MQQIRNLESVGVLPPADRTDTGHRRYTERHVASALGYSALAAGVGPVEAKSIMRAVHNFPDSDLLVRLDAAHARLADERRDLELAEQAAAAIAAEELIDVRPSDAMSISELADALGVRTSTLRHWDAEGLLVTDRDRGARSFSPAAVRDARIVHQLRLAGYGIPVLRALMPQLLSGRRWSEVIKTLTARRAAVDTRSRALLRAAALINNLLPAAP